jgi:arylsulfatase
VLEAAGIPAPQRVNGVDQQPIDGTSLLYAFGDAKAPARHRTQYFEVYGNRAIYHDGWIASARRARTPWTMAFTDQTPFEADRWELYDLRGDFSQSRDLAAQEPQRLRAMQDLFMAELARSGGWPLHVTASPEGLPSLVRGRKSFTFYPGAQGIPENSAPPLTSRSYTVTVRLDAARGASGPLVAEGGRSAGWALWIDERRRPGYTYRYFDEAVYTIVDTAPLAPGRREIQLRFDYAGGGPGRAATATLLVDGRSAGSARLERTVPAFFSIDETFGVGIDSGSAVGPYAGGAEFTGRLVDVRVELK